MKHPQRILDGNSLTLLLPSRNWAASYGFAVLAFASDASGISRNAMSPGLGQIESDTQDSGSRNINERTVQLYDNLRPSLYRYLLNRGLTPEEAEETVQETFLRLYKHLRKSGSDVDLRAWIYQVAHNLSVDTWKQRRRLVETPPESLTELVDLRIDDSLDPEGQVLHKERLLRIHHALSELTKLQRDCVSLRIEGFQYRKIAEILGVGIATVSGSLRNAITKLAKENV
jgi:RNA polymerase sigma-70 factor (ECF subfamily)